MSPNAIPPEISNAAARMLEPYAPGLTAERLAVAITYQPEARMEHLLTRREAAAALRVSAPTLDRMLRAGQIPKRRFRGAVRIPASAVANLISGKGGCHD